MSTKLVFKNSHEAVAGLPELYESIKNEPTGSIKEFEIQEMPGAQLAIKIQAASRVAINILTNNFFDKRPCDLVLKSGKEQDVSTLNSIGLSLVRVGVPVTGIIANYAQVINGYQQLSTQQMRSSIGAPSGRYQTHIPTISNLEVIGLLVTSQSTQKTLSDKIIEDELDYKGPLEAIRCTFKEPIYVKSGQFKEVVALENVNCQESLKAEKSTFERTVQVEKGDLELIDTKASKLIAKDKIKIENGDFKTAQSNQIKVTGSTSRRIDAHSQVEMINSKTQYVELTLKETPEPCAIVLTDSTVEKNVIITDSESTQEKAKSAGHQTTGFPPSFNYPKSNIKGVPPTGAWGRIEGKPYQFTKGDFVEGVDVILRGNGTINGDLVLNCKANLTIEGVTIKGSIIKNYEKQRPIPTGFDFLNSFQK